MRLKPPKRSVIYGSVIGLIILDIVTTLIGVNMLGAKEQNPIIAGIIHNPLLFVSIKLGTIVFILILAIIQVRVSRVERIIGDICLTGLLGLYGWVIFTNFLALILYLGR